MRKNIYIIKDTKADVFHDPILVDSRGRVLRMFSDLVNGNKDNEIAKHPSDFCLFEIGTFDSLTGNVEIFEAPISLGCALDFVLKA